MYCARQNQINERIILNQIVNKKQLSFAQVSNQTALKTMMSDTFLLNPERCCILDDPRGGAFAFFGLTLRHFTDLFFPTPQKFALFFLKANTRSWPGIGGMGAAGID